MMPTRRNLHFRLKPGSVCNWHAQGPYVTHFANAMSVFFPPGERYFIDTVRHYREQITDPELQQAVTAFIGQEAMHGREHDEYNRCLNESGLPAAELEAHAARFLQLLRDWLPPSAQLAVTIAQEHFTAIVSELVLTDPRMLEGADRNVEALWRWHALEETEHKAVAFDVYITAMGRGLKSYLLRSGGLAFTTVGFLGLVLYYQARLMQADPTVRRWEGLGKFMNYLFRSPAMLPRLALPWLAYFRPGFHPWDRDNRDVLKQIDALITETQTPELRAA